MAKKSRRKKKDVRLSPAQMVQPGMEDVSVADVADAKASPALQESDLEDEYQYVVADLKRIGLIAAVMLVVLVALVFLLP